MFPRPGLYYGRPKGKANMSVSGEDVNTVVTAIPVIKKIVENVGYVFTGVLIMTGLGYRIGKEHSRYQKLCTTLAEIVENQKNFITKKELLEEQRICQGEVALAIQEQIAVLNSNICLIMGQQGITPIVANHAKSKRSEDKP